MYFQGIMVLCVSMQTGFGIFFVDGGAGGGFVG